MKLTVYLHDLFYEIGHSNVTLNSLQYINNFSEYDIKFVVFTHDKKENLFINNPKNLSIHKVPFQNLKPVLLKIIWFQIYTFFYALVRDRKRTRISLGIANLSCHISIIHFIHKQWSTDYFKVINPKGIHLIYKKVLYFYTILCEYVLFKLTSPKIITVSEFLKTYIRKEFHVHESNITCIHSGFELERFKPSTMDTTSIVEELKKENIDLSHINFKIPTSLFVGAFERKGLDKVLDCWDKNNKSINLIIIGQSETQRNRKNLNQGNITYIPFTKNINLFYEISDYFLFPTIYEPFGMVLIESAMKGLNIYSTTQNVGASEILHNLSGINLYPNSDLFSIPQRFIKLSNEDREKNIVQRFERLKQYNWHNISKKYKHVFEQL